MGYAGIIFDFNGTLLWDMDLHDQVWEGIALEMRGRGFTREELHTMVHGHTNREIFPYVLGRAVGSAECDELSECKEQRYRALISAMPERMHLVPGAEDLFDLCQAQGIRFAIGTAAGRSNVDFYIESFKLHRWFSPERIVYDDGSLPGKPDPAIFSLAMSRLGLPPESCIVVEDAPLGIEAATRAGSTRIIGLYADDAGRAKLDPLPLYRRIHTFHEMGLADFA